MQFGGSTLWLRDRPFDFQRYRCGLAPIAEIDAKVPADAEVLVIEDAQHDDVTTRAALHGLAHLIKPGGYYVVEDTCVDVEALRVNEQSPCGAGTELEQWLTTDVLGRRFRRRSDLQLYGITCHHGGLVQRLADV